MKKIIKLLFLAVLGILFFSPLASFASNVEWLDSVIWQHNLIDGWSSSISDTVNIVWKRFLSTVKNIFSWVMLIIMVYAGAQMIISQWDDEEMLSNSKRMLWYSVIGLFFINMPWTLYEAIKWDRTNVWWWIWTTWANDVQSGVANLFINADVFSATLNTTIIRFIKVGLVWLSVMIIMIAWIKIMTARWREDQVNEWKEKILWALVWLIFVWFIEAWQRFAYTWIISDWRDIFKTMANLALFISVPTAIFFLSLAWYYFITAAWDEEKMNKGKSIIVNTLIWTAILLVSFVFLYDLIQI